MIKKVCVFCGSSPSVDKSYLDEAWELGRLLTEASVAVNYGCGAFGLMGSLASSILQYKGKITGIIPAFMVEYGWSNPKITETIVTHDMRERKRLMIADVDAIIALPGGIGTLEEVMEVITLKQLGQYSKPIVLLNTNGFYNHLTAFLDEMIRQQFLKDAHKDIWTVVDSPSEVIKAIEENMVWESRVNKLPTNLPE
jgi:uncharacterized protein (TIGR00730 family)